MWASLVVLTALSMLVCVHRLFVADRVRMTHADRTAAPWLQVATYAGGRITHVTPVRDGIHLEDEAGSCPCHPKVGAYSVDGGSGIFYTHRSLAASSQQPAQVRVPRRFRPGWRWPE